MASGDVILVVEDDESLRTLLQMTLEDAGYDVISAEHGEIALSLASQHPPKLILLDLRMPVMDGWKFGQLYRERLDRTTPIVVLTAGSDRTLNLQELPGETVLPKPFELNDLLAVVKRYLPVDS